MQNDSFEHSMSHSQEEPPVTASLVAEDRRSDFLAAFFEPWLTKDDEKLVYSWLGRLCADYHDAYWHYYELSNGSFYMAPDLPGRLPIEVETNGFSAEMSADAAGIVATLFALCQLIQEIHEREETSEGDALFDRYYLLRDFALAHIERDLIFRAID